MLQVSGPRRQCICCFSTQHLQSFNEHGQYGDQHRLDTTLQPPQVTSLTAVSGHSSVNQQVMDQFTEMKTILSSVLRQKQETTHPTFCNYLASEVEGIEDKDLQTFRNEAVKLLSSIQNRAEEQGRQPQQPQQQTLSQNSSATSTFVPQQPTPAARECILTITETQMPASQVIQSSRQSQVATKGQQQISRGQSHSFLVVDNQQAGPSRPLTFTLTVMKHFNPSSVASANKVNTTY